jgi:chorismate dehydratase
MKIGNVSYLNSFPFRYGLKSSTKDEIEMLVPSKIASQLELGTIDIGLVPVASYLQHKSWGIISDYCISAQGAVKTVLLISKKPISEVKTICYDTDSRSSNMLTKVLSANYWKITPTEASFEDADARVVIGDKAFTNYPDYPFIYDLAIEWMDFQQLPFVFAVWVSNKELSTEENARISQMFGFGVHHIQDAIEFYKEQLPVSREEAYDYLTINISFTLDANKRLAIERFGKFAADLGLI